MHDSTAHFCPTMTSFALVAASEHLFARQVLRVPTLRRGQERKMGDNPTP
jgi:hypothetical protein